MANQQWSTAKQLGTPALAVVFDYVAHKTVFEPGFQKEIEEQTFFVERFYPYYISKYGSVLVAEVIVNRTLKKKTGIKPHLAVASLGSIIFGMYYGLTRPLPTPKLGITMAINHFLDVLGASLLVNGYKKR